MYHPPPPGPSILHKSASPNKVGHARRLRRIFRLPRSGRLHPRMCLTAGRDGSGLTLHALYTVYAFDCVFAVMFSALRVGTGGQAPEVLIRAAAARRRRRGVAVSVSSGR